MVTAELTEHLKEAEDKSVLDDAEVARWFFESHVLGPGILPTGMGLSTRARPLNFQRGR